MFNHLFISIFFLRILIKKLFNNIIITINFKMIMCFFQILLNLKLNIIKTKMFKNKKLQA